MSTLAEQAEARKEKLVALRRRKEGHGQGIESNGDAAADKRARSDFRFRNYDPSSSGPRRHAKAGDEETVEKAVEGVMERTRQEDEARRAAELDIVTIQPKRPNWDLKRDLDKKLAKLQPMTDAAIATLVRRRLLGQNGGEADLATQMKLAGPDDGALEGYGSD